MVGAEGDKLEGLSSENGEAESHRPRPGELQR